MMDEMRDQISRRELLVGGVVYGSSLWLLLELPRPLAARAAATSSRPLVLTEGSWKTVEAITARIIPTDDQPGAVEAGCTNFIDKALAHEDAALKPLYKDGIAGIDAVSRERFQKPFVALSAEEQDEVLAALESGRADGWSAKGHPPAKFFEAVRAHTIIAFLADPKYGGNRGYAGWTTVGYPGGGHHLGGYSPAQLMGREKIRTAWGEEV
jgi:gluconate 2-dehydrogenase gamma chain